MKKTVGLRKFLKMYSDGFRNLSKTSKTLCIIILIKLFIMFAVMRAFLLQNFLNSVADNDKEKADYVSTQITKGVE